MYAINTIKTTKAPFPLLRLPPETIGAVIEEIVDIETLISVSQSCQVLHSLFNQKKNSIVRNIFALYDRIESPQQRAIQLYRALELALSHRSLPLPPLEYAFTKAWALLRDDGMEEILYPVATRLALCLSEKGHAQEQKRLLERIWNAEAPYEVENYRRRSPSLMPIAEMLQELVSEGRLREAIRTRIYELEQVKKRSKPYFIHVRKDQIVNSIWEDCNVTYLKAFLLPQSKRVAKLSFNTEERTPFQPPVTRG